MSRRLRATLCALLLPASAAAHDLWLEPAGDGLALRRGHRGGETLPFDAAALKGVRCLDGDSSPRVLHAAEQAGDRELLVPDRCAVVTASVDGGLWSLTPDGERNVGRRQAPDAVKAWASRAFAKWVDAGSPAAARVAGDELELVPVSDLREARSGRKATFRVLSAGQPVPDAVVAIAHHALGRTDSHGEIRVQLRAADVESITASVRRPLSSPDADVLILEASLTFEVAR